MRTAFHRPPDAPLPRRPVVLPATSRIRALDLEPGMTIVQAGFIDRRVTSVDEAPICGLLGFAYEFGGGPGRGVLVAGSFVGVRHAVIEQAH